jgi:hypothetical protein
MKRIILLALATLMVVASAVPAAAITQGTPDGEGHPMVGLLFYEVPGEGWFVCTGTALSETVVLTAGHCTDGVGTVHVTFDEVPEGLAEIVAGAEEVPGTWYTGTAHTAPGYDPNAFVMRDLGLVVLDTPAALTEFGVLPDAGYLDAVMADRKNDRLFTPVGYGIDSLVPTFTWTLTRQWSTSKLIDIRGTHGIPAGTVAKFSNNLGKKHTGGACSGDSGGPLFKQNTFVIGAITSYGISPCIGTDGAYRIDKVADLEWINGFL